MPFSIKLTADGIEELSDGLDSLASVFESGGAISEAISQLFSDIYDGISDRCPVDTGFMKSTISKNEEEENVSYNVNVDAGYTGFVEFGHHTRGFTFVPPVYFIRPGYEKLRAEATNTIVSAIGNRPHG